MSFWKKLFEKEVNKETLDFYKISEWLVENASIDIEPEFAELEDIKNRLLTNLDILDKVDVSKMKVEPRLMSLVLGNRPAYVHAVSRFVKALHPPKYLTCRELTNFCIETEKELDKLTQKTQRNYLILQNLIGKELVAIAEDLKGIDVVVRRVAQKINEGHLELVEDLQERLQHIYGYLDKKDSREEEVKELQDKKDKLMEKQQKLQQKIDGLKKGRGFIELNESRNREEELLAQIQEAKNSFETVFSPIQKALKKFGKQQKSKRITDYAEKPFFALMKDESLRIVNILQKLEKKIVKGDVGLKGNKKTKTLAILDKVDNAFLESIVVEVQDAEKELKAVKSKLAKNTYEEEVNTLTQKFDRVNGRIVEVYLQVNNIKEKNIAEDVKKIEKDLNKLSGSSFVIENAPVD